MTESKVVTDKEVLARPAQDALAHASWLVERERIKAAWRATVAALLFGVVCAFAIATAFVYHQELLVTGWASGLAWFFSIFVLSPIGCALMTAGVFGIIYGLSRPSQQGVLIKRTPAELDTQFEIEVIRPRKIERDTTRDRQFEDLLKIT